jgi:hypothetical protein
MDKTQLVHRDPNDLQLHRLLKQIPEPDKKSLEWNSFVESVRASGVVDPLIITQDNLVMRGGNRWRAARQVELDDVPCLVRPDNEAGVLIVDGLLHCRHMTRGAAVYLSLTMLKDFIDSANSRRLANLSKGGKTNQNPLKTSNASNLHSEETTAELCQSWGVSWETFRRARMVLEIFTKNAALKKEWEPKLLSGEKNLWNVLSAIGGAGADQTNRERGVIDAQLELFGETFSNLKTGARAWSKFNSEQREKILTTGATRLKRFPKTCARR